LDARKRRQQVPVVGADRRACGIVIALATLLVAGGCGGARQGEAVPAPPAEPPPASESQASATSAASTAADEQASQWRAAAAAACLDAGPPARERLAVLDDAEADFYQRQDPASAEVYKAAYTDAADALAALARGLAAIEVPQPIAATVAELAENLDLAVIMGQSLGRGGEDRAGEGQLEFDDRIRMARDNLRELGLPACF
jgi:hypothetical protein